MRETVTADSKRPAGEKFFRAILKAVATVDQQRTESKANEYAFV